MVKKKKKKKKEKMETEYENEECDIKSRQVVLSASKFRMAVMALPKPLVGENLGAFSLNIFSHLQVSKLHMKKWLTIASARVIKLFEGIRFVLVVTSKKKKKKKKKKLSIKKKKVKKKLSIKKR